MYVGIAIMAFVALSCSSSNSAAPSLVGSIAGQIALLDSSGYASPAGIAVSISPLNRTSITDSSGKWRFDDLPVGTYVLSATKFGYGTIKWFNEHVVGPGTFYLGSVTLAQSPNCSVVLDSVRYDSLRSEVIIKCFGKVSGVESLANIYLQVDLDSTIQPDQQHIVPTLEAVEAPGNGSWNTTIYPNELRGLPKGTKLYLAAYCESNLGGSYYDPIDNQSIPISPGRKSNVLTFIVP